MSNNVIDPRRDGKTELSRVNQFAVMAMGVLLARIEQLSDEDREDLFEALISIKEDPSHENYLAVEVTFEEILRQETVEVEPVKVESDSQSSPWSSFVATRVKELRKSVGLTQEQLAEMAGLHQAHVCRIERGEISPTRKTIEKLADAFQIDVSAFDPSA